MRSSGVLKIIGAGDDPVKLESRADAGEEFIAELLQRREVPRCKFFLKESMVP
jgi:hypothetical protein